MNDLASDWESMSEFVPDDAKLGESVKRALAVLFTASQIDGAHHKAWVIDQITHLLTGDNYESFIAHYNFDLDISDPENLRRYLKIASGDYVVGDFEDDEVEKVENSYYDWDEGTPP